MDYAKLLEGLIPVVGQLGVTELAEEFKSLASGADQSWKQVSLLILADAVAANGPAGVALAQKAVHDLLDHKVPECDWLNPRTASDLVAKLQTAEADAKNKSAEFFAKLGGALGALSKAMISSLAS